LDLSTFTYRFSAALSAALLLLSVLAVPANATHIAGLPDDPTSCVADPTACLPDPVGGIVGDPLGGGGVLPGLGGGLPGLGGGLPGGLPGVGGGVPGVGGGLPGVGGGLPELPGGLPPVENPPTVPSNPVGGAPQVAPPATEQKPDPEPSKSKPDSEPKHTSPAPDRVVVEPADGRTTSAGTWRRSGSGGKSRSHDTQGGPLSGEAILGSGPVPPSPSSPLVVPSGVAKRGGGVAGFAGRLLQRIPEQYRWPVFVLSCIATFFALNTLRERFRSMRALDRALTDSLTSLPNRLAFEQALAKEYKRADRYDRPLSMLLLDLDGFKEINDTYGHAAGDDVLRKAAVAIASRIRTDDLAARLSGDEFVILCPETSTASAQELARSLEESLAEVSIRSSIGVAEREMEDDGVPEYLVARADASMYRCKQRSGGGRERRSKPVSSGQPLAGMAGA
jgi:diguanylate cyclase (GGDEF)-like protein